MNKTFIVLLIAIDTMCEQYVVIFINKVLTTT